jgi:hypothetical protein
MKLRYLPYIGMVIIVLNNFPQLNYIFLAAIIFPMLMPHKGKKQKFRNFCIYYLTIRMLLSDVY